MFASKFDTFHFYKVFGRKFFVSKFGKKIAREAVILLCFQIDVKNKTIHFGHENFDLISRRFRNL
jgi:hypothetical protein